MKVTGTYYQEDKHHLVKLINEENEIRIFKVYSGRAGKTLALMAEAYPSGITTKDMREKHGIDDNKLFGELLDQSGFREYMEHIGTKERLKVWKLHLEVLWINTSDLASPIWFGIHTQGNLQKYFDDLEKLYGLRCNILGNALYKSSKGKFSSNFRKIAIDHRVPQLKGGEDKIENLQLLSFYINERKNQICAKCIDSICNQCVLAYPEKTSIIFPTQEDISDLTNWRNEN
jgi:hypothetical protein